MLVGGLEHFLFSHILGITIPTDKLIFFRGVGQPPTRMPLFLQIPNFRVGWPQANFTDVTCPSLCWGAFWTNWPMEWWIKTHHCEHPKLAGSLGTSILPSICHVFRDVNPPSFSDHVWSQHPTGPQSLIAPRHGTDQDWNVRAIRPVAGSTSIQVNQWSINAIWLVVWNMAFIFPYIGNFIIPTDEIIFFGGVGQPPTR